ncbi:MAG: peptide deformylase [Synechococcaceae cyanobacterium]
MARSFAQMARVAEKTSNGLLLDKSGDQPAPLEIRRLGSRDLRQNTRRISKVDDSVRDLARDMLRSMYAARGIGLAAPQVGVQRQLLVIDLDLDEAATPPLVLINPEISAAGASLNTYEEGCLSIPGVYLNVVRPSVVEVSYRDDMGRPRRLKADGLLARCIQHELDHLNGVLFVDRVSDELGLVDSLQQHGFQRDHVQPIH